MNFNLGTRILTWEQKKLKKGKKRLKMCLALGELPTP